MFERYTLFLVLNSALFGWLPSYESVGINMDAYHTNQTALSNNSLESTAIALLQLDKKTHEWINVSFLTSVW